MTLTVHLLLWAIAALAAFLAMVAWPAQDRINLLAAAILFLILGFIFA